MDECRIAAIRRVDGCNSTATTNLRTAHWHQAAASRGSRSLGGLCIEGPVCMMLCDCRDGRTAPANTFVSITRARFTLAFWIYFLPRIFFSSKFKVCCWQTRHRAHTGSQREESGESQFLGSLWRATLSREAWMPIWGLSTERLLDRVRRRRTMYDVVEHKWRMAVAPLHERLRRRSTYRFRVEFQRADGCED